MAQSNDFEKRKLMYKGNSPHWKETYRKRCHERLKRSRELFMQRFRQSPVERNVGDSMLHNMMEEEWMSMQSEIPALRGVPFKPNSSMQELDEDIDGILTFLDGIKSEMMYEEQRLIDDVVNYEEGLLSAAIGGLSDVVCPICQKSKIFMSSGVIFCRCGLKINTEQDCISLSTVKENIDFGLQQHGSTCDKVPKFSVFNSVGVDSLMMTCEVCDHMYVVV
ncbi:hypothetical protein CAPTEDRAFT_223210 [Capitella teleta]|uniref:RPA-interacting protein C-terminal domain-containing protein n=1 Tax=Capitella teleta TaxID=283909 RepID=R7US38_CAPTE|nr:hypothetical protein CAPTEDRAFT_223210 [Capitella teleta]|eukprot:ELU09329.1 hypothetical protein CAPTEDRAFT_223210 [Capitella teleta]